jgi:hypothetical protein
MEIKVVHPELKDILIGMALVFLFGVGVSVYDDLESTRYRAARDAESYDVIFECEKYIEKFPEGEHIDEVADIYIAYLKEELDASGASAVAEKCRYTNPRISNS